MSFPWSNTFSLFIYSHERRWLNNYHLFKMGRAKLSSPVYRFIGILALHRNNLQISELFEALVRGGVEQPGGKCGY